MTVPPITSIISFVSSESDDKCDSVAQLDRAFDYESKGRRFESCRGHQLKISTAEYAVFFYFYWAAFIIKNIIIKITKKRINQKSMGEALKI